MRWKDFCAGDSTTGFTRDMGDFFVITLETILVLLVSSQCGASAGLLLPALKLYLRDNDAPIYFSLLSLQAATACAISSSRRAARPNTVSGG